MSYLCSREINLNRKVDGHRARKRFGQNFLQDANVINQIIKAINPKIENHVVEIGPGLGALTDELIGHCFLTVIELDRDLVNKLERKYSQHKNFEIHQGDALKFDFSKIVKDNLTEKIKLVGNLPYNISTPLIFYLLKYKDLIADMHFMLQKEVVERITSEPGSKTYGRLSVILQYACETNHLFNVEPEAFKPAPKVDSAIIRIKPREIIAEPVADEFLFQRLVTQAFSQRRKTIRNTLKTLASDTQLQAAQIDPGVRPETVSVQNYVRLTNILDNAHT